MKKARKPTVKERVKGSWDFLIDGIKSFFVFRFDQARFDFHMIIPTIKGQFEVVKKGE